MTICLRTKSNQERLSPVEMVAVRLMAASVGLPRLRHESQAICLANPPFNDRATLAATRKPRQAMRFASITTAGAAVNDRWRRDKQR